ncbi:hypothetical protein BBJ28_00008211 [Nothophytophthora sp. Chile5]|nr:hypothetical protein BBJ28_00008211 [Nothophytophthora sp. Chile5]
MDVDNRGSQVLFDGFTRKKFADRTVGSFAVFKDGIVPEWEDPENKKGGEWSVRKGVCTLGAQELDDFWEKLVLGAIGELIDPGNEVTGVRVLHKNKEGKKDSGNNYRYEVWLRGTDRAKADEIRAQTAEVVNSGGASSLVTYLSPCCYRNLLSPRRKALYALFAFGPGTLLGLYLYSVKRRMERDNESMRMEQVQEELAVVEEQQNKDMVLSDAIQELRDRLHRLESEVTTSRQSAAKASQSGSEKPAKAAPAASEKPKASRMEEALTLLKAKPLSKEQQQHASDPAWFTALSGVQERAKQSDKEMLKRDVAAFKADQKQREDAK